jgi:hypothetical protein
MQKEANGLHTKLQHIDTDNQQLSYKISLLNSRIHSYHSDRSSLFKKIRLHIKDERNQHILIMKEKKQGLTNKLRLKNDRINALSEYMTLSRKIGKNQDRLNWINESGHYHESNHANKLRLRRRLDRLNQQIYRQQESIGMARMSYVERQKILYLMQIAEYTGELDSQLNIFKQLDNRDEVQDFIRFHYIHEPEYIAKYSDRYLLHDQPKKSLHTLRNELRHAMLEQDRLLLERKDVIYQLDTLEQDILHMKTTSVYR